jgi:glycosyltransferase involved in cell wall biosynthesis
MEDLIARGEIASDSNIWFVDDGSKDGTWRLIESFTQESDLFVGVKLSRNRGHQNALLSGLMTADGDAVISIDADLQDPPLVAAALGSEFSLGDFLQNDLVDRELRYRLLQPRVLRLELPHSLRLVNPKAAVALAPPKVRLVRHAELLAGLPDCLALTDQHIRLTQLVNDLLGRIPLYCHDPDLLVPPF